MSMAAGYDWTLARELWVAGVPGREIAARVGCGASSVFRVRREQGWPARRGYALVAPAPIRCRCGWCAAVYPLAGPDAARVCPHCGQGEIVT